MEIKSRCKVIYEDENRFTGLLRAVRLYNMAAYKEFIFKYMPEIRAGKFSGTLNGNGIYRQYLKSSPEFEFVHGKVYIEYTVNKNVVCLVNIEPTKFLQEGRKVTLKTYKGVPITNARDIFAVDYYRVTH